MKPDLYLLGEIWHDASQWLLGDEYDSVMNYPLMSGIHDFFLDRGMEKEEFEYMVNRCYTMYMQQSNNVMFNLLDSHDTQRLMSRFDDLDLFYQQLAVLFTMPGSACIYYGTEIAMEGGFDPDCRRMYAVAGTGFIRKPGKNPDHAKADRNAETGSSLQKSVFPFSE